MRLGIKAFCQDLIFEIALTLPFMSVALPTILGAFSGVVIAAEAPSPDVTLTETDRVAIETRLGRGSLGQPLTAPIIDEPVHWSPGQLRYATI